MSMHKTTREAISIFNRLDPGSVHTVLESISGTAETGTPMELLNAIIDQDKISNGNISHRAYTDAGWAIIEVAYAVSDGDAVIFANSGKWITA